MEVLVIGATGMLGKPVAERLKADGHTVRVFTRNADKAGAIFAAGYTIKVGDIADTRLLTAAMQGCDAVHVNLRGGPTLADYERVMREGIGNIVQAARQTKVQRLTFLSGGYTAPEYTWAPVVQGNSWAEAAIKGGGVPYTIFRSTSFMESLPQYVQGSRATIVGKHPHPIHWVTAADYARMVSRALNNVATTNKTLVVHGPEGIRMPEAIKRYCATVRPDVKVSQMPQWMFDVIANTSRSAELQSLAKMLRLFNTVPEPGDPSETNRLVGAPRTTLTQWLQQVTARAERVI